MDEEKEKGGLVLVARKACFGLPTACPSCLPVFFYLRFANVPFDIRFNLIHPDTDQIPYVESGDYVAYNNEKGGCIESLKEDGVVDLDSGLPSHTIPEWVSMKATISSWLADAVMHELWIGADGNPAKTIFYSDLPWPIGKILQFKQIHSAKQLLGITKENAERREAEIYRRASMAYEALSTKLGDQTFFFENRPTSLDALFLGHALFTLQALPQEVKPETRSGMRQVSVDPSKVEAVLLRRQLLQCLQETSVLRGKLLEHSNLVRYSENLKMRFLEADTSSSSSVPRSPSVPSSSTTPKRGATANWNTKPKSKPKREKTEEEKTFRRRAKYFIATQLVAVLVFLSLFGGSGADVEDADDDEDLSYDD